MGGGGFSGAEFSLSPPPASYLQRGWAGSSLEFLSPFVLRNAGGVFWLVNFSLLSHSLKKLPPTALRAFRPVLTLSNAARSSPFRPHLLVVDVSIWGTFLLGVVFRHVICGFYLFFLPVRLPSKIRKLPQNRQCEGFLVFVNFLYQDSLPGTGLRPFLLCLPFYLFNFLSYLPSKTMGCFSGHLMSSASDQKLFCEVCSVLNCSFPEFVGEKVVSPSYSSTILAPPTMLFLKPA